MASQIFRIYSHISPIFSAEAVEVSFNDFFGGSGSRRHGTSRRNMGERGSDLRIQLSLTMEEMATGVEKTLKLKKHVICDSCKGTGAKSGSGFNTCPTCNGTGQIRHVQRSMFGQFVNISGCPTCNGTGQVIKERCTNCGGEGENSRRGNG